MKGKVKDQKILYILVGLVFSFGAILGVLLLIQSSQSDNETQNESTTKAISSAREKTDESNAKVKEKENETVEKVKPEVKINSTSVKQINEDDDNNINLEYAADYINPHFQISIPNPIKLDFDTTTSGDWDGYIKYESEEILLDFTGDENNDFSEVALSFLTHYDSSRNDNFELIKTPGNHLKIQKESDIFSYQLFEVSDKLLSTRYYLLLANVSKVHNEFNGYLAIKSSSTDGLSLITKIFNSVKLIQ